MKRRSLTLVICLLATLSLASVGFASWVISAGDTENVTGNVQVQAVTDKRLEIGSVTFDKDGQGNDIKNIIFGIVDGYVAGQNDWLSPDNIQTFPEDQLVVSFSTEVTFKNGDGVVTTGSDKNVNVSVELSDDTKAWLEEAVSLGYIKSADVLDENIGEDGSIDCTLTFAWGALFGNQNPWSYYNAKGVAEALNGLDSKTGLTFVDPENGVHSQTAAEPEPHRNHVIGEDGHCNGTYEVTIEGDNPATDEPEERYTKSIACDYYNTTYGDHAATFLQKMYNYLNSKTYEVVIEANEHTHVYDQDGDKCECGADKPVQQ